MGLEIQKDSRGNTVTNSYAAVNNIYLNGLRVATLVPSGEVTYYLTDQVDSVKVVVNEQGLPISRTEFQPYGETWFQEGNDNFAPKYNSQELDKESGLYFYNARYYDADVGRFVTADNVIDGEYDTQGWNRYSYVKGNPVGAKDPDGHEMIEPNSSDGTGYWNIEKGENLSRIVQSLNKQYSMDITLNDIIKANPQISDKNKIYTGNKVKLPFLHFEKSYYIYGFTGNTVVNLGSSYKGEMYGTAFVREKKTISNNISGRVVRERSRDTIYYDSKIATRWGACIEGPGAFVGKGSFNNLDHAKNAFMGGALTINTGLPVGVSMSEGLYSDGFIQRLRGRWYVANVSIAVGISAGGEWTEADNKQGLYKNIFNKLHDKNLRETEVIEKGNRSN